MTNFDFLLSDPQFTTFSNRIHLLSGKIMENRPF